LESVIRAARIETYKAQLAMCNHVRAALSKELENSNLTDEQRASIGHRCEEALMESYSLQFLLDLMGRQGREEHVNAGSAIPTA
jgi:hypothetical protein